MALIEGHSQDDATCQKCAKGYPVIRCQCGGLFHVEVKELEYLSFIYMECDKCDIFRIHDENHEKGKSTCSGCDGHFAGHFYPVRCKCGGLVHNEEEYNWGDVFDHTWCDQCGFDYREVV